jgi:hypothetical protein
LVYDDFEPAAQQLWGMELGDESQELMQQKLGGNLS